MVENNGKDVSEQFHYFEHSDYAKKLLKNLNINAKKNLNIKDTNFKLKKLFTKEDANFSHKILGISCLLNYIYRFSRLFFGYSTFTNPFDILIWSCIHLYLNLSSFKFHIPKERINSKPMIWQEFRFHNLLFTARSCIAMLFNLLYIQNIISHKILILLKCILIYSTILYSDIITKNYRINNIETTTRTMPYWSDCSTIQEKIHKWYYAFSQFEATFSCLSDSVITPFIVMMPIQLSSLLMTLVRKGFLSSKSWHLLYFLSLFIPEALYLRDYVFLTRVLPLSILCVYLRKKNISKYLIWTVILNFYIINNFV